MYLLTVINEHDDDDDDDDDDDELLVLLLLLLLVILSYKSHTFVKTDCFSIAYKLNRQKVT